MSADLHDINSLHARISGAVGVRLARAHAAQNTTAWHARETCWTGIAPESVDHILANAPDAVIRHCERDLKILARHNLCEDYEPGDEMYCDGCRGYDPPWPCEQIRDLAEAYGITEDSGGEQ